MNIKSFLFVATCCWFNFSYACKCPIYKGEAMVANGLANAEIVFYGKLVKVDSVKNTYSFRIIELFKGKYKSDIINGKFTDDGCEIFPFELDFYIVYTNLNTDKTISLNYCLPTQTTKIPPGFLPPIPLIGSSEKLPTKLDSLSNEIDNLKMRNETINNWFYQLEQLRLYKLSQNKLHENDKKIPLNLIAIFSLIINVILVGFMIYRFSNKKFSSNNQING